ncbi:Transcription termination factor 2 [Spatholobus suberectus]|nr:Transcription termination factor 2 [Spatholobus suberectus]
MADCIYISSSDDDLEEIEDPRRALPHWATTTERSSDYGGWSRRDSSSRGANSSNPSSSNVYNHSQAKPHTLPVSSTNTLNHRIVRRDELSYHAQNGNTSQHQTVNSGISNTHGADYEKMSSQQAFKRTLPSSLQPSVTRALPSSSFASDNRLSDLKDNVSSSQHYDAYKNRRHGVGPSTSSDRGYIHDNFSRGNDEDRFFHQNGGIRIHPSSLMLGKAITPQFASSSESAYRSGVGDERASGNDERLIYEAALQDISQPKTEYDLPAGVLSVSLLRHQKIALAWMLQKETKSLHCLGGILADDQGLGKTISMIALILAQRSLQSKSKTDDMSNHKTEALNLDDDDDDNGSVDVEKQKKSEESDDVKPIIEPSSSTQAPGRKRPAAGTLVVCPASVLRQWARELDEKVGDEKLSALVYHGGSRTKDPVELAKFDVVLTTYSIVTNEVPKQPLVEEEDIDEKNGERFGLSSEFSVSKKRKSHLMEIRRVKKVEKELTILLLNVVLVLLQK